MKNTLLNKLLCFALCVAMAAAMVTVPAFAANSDIGPHEHQWEEKSTYEGYNCELGNCWMYYEECSICHAQKQIAFRKYDGKKGEHQFAETVIKTDCPVNDRIEQVCSICHAIKVVAQGGHNWTTDGPEKPGAICTESSTQDYICSNCGATKTEKTGKWGSHSFETVTTTATCTENGMSLLRCTKCGYETNQKVIEYAKGHKWTGGTNHTEERTCSVCGEVAPATDHTYDGWKTDSSSHWQECTKCGEKSGFGAHTYNTSGRCTVCGYGKPADVKHNFGGWVSDATNHWKECSDCGFKSGLDTHSFNSSGKCIYCGYTKTSGCNHSWSITKRNGVFNHYEKCDICGETRSVSCTWDGNRTYCTDDLYCACGNKVQEGQRKHNFGTWICHDDSHEHHCLNIGCQYVEGGAHTYQTISGLVVCSQCRYVDRSASAAHTHSLGTADCTGHAVCSTCGATVSAPANSSNHVGATEIRNAVAATTDKAGYTGDTYCKACGQVISKGETIPALTAAHTHSYTILTEDASGHWHQCQCGAKSGFSGHSGGTATCSTQATCSVCGESYGSLDHSNHAGGTRVDGAKAAAAGVPGYTGDVHCLGCGELISAGKSIDALSTNHTHSYVTKSDSVSHWQECACGERKDEADHVFANGFCSVCGAKEPEKLQAHVHTYDTVWHSDATSHWHQCTACGEMAERTTHNSVNGVCADCGMSTARQEGLAQVEMDKRTAEAELAGNENVATMFSDVEKDQWYSVHVQRVVDYGLMNGMDSSFGTNSYTRRIQVMIILARMNSVEEATNTEWEYMQDVAEDWALTNGIAEEGSRSEDITRSELVLMLWRNAGKVKTDTDLSRFADVGELTGDTAEAMKWAVSVGVIDGRSSSDGRLLACPNDKAPRSEIAKILATYIDATAGDIIDVTAF